MMIRRSGTNWLLIAAAGWVLSLAGCGGTKPAVPTASMEAPTKVALTSATTDVPFTPGAEPAPIVRRPPVDPIVVVHTSAGDIKVQLFIQQAPQTVDNFLRNYVHRGYYEQTIFHHVDKSMMIAAGGFGPDLQGKPTRTPVVNEASNGLKNERGTIAMARDPSVAHSATSQFFFNLVDNAALDYVADTTDAEFGYCVFGKVLEGLDVIDKIAESPVGPQGDFPAVPTDPILIQSIEQVQ
jgi:cyclophilin family peptidyl-prolyl cis-trans isomerase